MSDDRPRPEYGEYATPEQQAAAMGRHYVPPAPPPPLPNSRVNLAPPASDVPHPAEPARLAGFAADRFATIFQIGIGVVFLINSNYFQFGENLNSVLAQIGQTVRVPVIIDHYAWVLLIANGVFLILTALWAYRRIRRDRLAFFVPVIGYVAFNVFVAVFAGLLTR